MKWYQYRVVAHQEDGFTTHWQIERSVLGWWWRSYGKKDYQIQTAKDWCDHCNNPPAKPIHSRKVVHP